MKKLILHTEKDFGAGTKFCDDDFGRHCTHFTLDVAMECNKMALKTNPTNIKALYGLGKYCIERRNMEGAETIVLKLLCLNEDSCEAFVLMGHINLHRSNLHESYKNFARARHLAICNDRFLIYGISLLYEAVGDYATARPWFVLLSRLGIEKQKEYEVLFRTGICLKKLGRLEDSVNVFRVIVYDHVHKICDTRVQIQMAHVYEMQSKDELAMEILNTMETPGKYSFLVCRLKAWIEFKTRSFTKMEEQCRYCYKNDPYIVYLFGRAKYAEGNKDGAIENYIKACELSDMDGMIWNSIGYVHSEEGKLLLAKDAFLHVTKANPNHLLAQKNLKLVEKAIKNGVEPENFQCCFVEEDVPSIERTGCMNSETFFDGPTCSVEPEIICLVPPLKMFKFESLPGWPK